ncbi:MAG: hypothetical protein IJQ52_05550 [Bacteroidales bacterium]|nr:hypothetical protein [Bacteroidales bacterium]
MDDIELKTPEGYFEESFARTMTGVAEIRIKRRSALRIAAIVLVVLGITFSSIRINKAREEKEFLAFQTEMADIDIFLEIN